MEGTDRDMGYGRGLPCPCPPPPVDVNNLYTCGEELIKMVPIELPHCSLCNIDKDLRAVHFKRIRFFDSYFTKTYYLCFVCLDYVNSLK